MKSMYRLCFLLVTLTAVSPAQDLTRQQLIDRYLDRKGEVYFQFHTDSHERINELSRMIAIDRVVPANGGFIVNAYANREEMEQFSGLHIECTVLPHPGDAEHIRMSAATDTVINWNVYPTYDAYVTLMYDFAARYPGICQIVDAGLTVQSRHILFARITNFSDSLNVKPKVMLSSTMHGDETAGYVTLLHLIDTLLRSYANDSPVGHLVSDFEIWINPLANPDGTYWSGNHTVTGARRYNANNKDLNRNFPDPAAGPNPGGTWQPETLVMMQIATQNAFTLSANFHGGEEVFNFPWDTWARLHPDNDWFIRLARLYVDTVHAYSHSDYMTAVLGYPNLPGIVNGYAWYRVTGGRQDYMTYFRHSKEVTIELSGTKLVPADSLHKMWNYNVRSLLQFIDQARFGLQGMATDSVTGLPLKASITVIGRDLMDSTYVLADSVSGKYFRPIQEGVYSVLFRCAGYYPLTVTNVRVGADSTTVLNVRLTPVGTDIKNINPDRNQLILYRNYPNPFNPTTTITYCLPAAGRVSLEIYNALGQKVRTLVQGTQTAGMKSVVWNGASDAGEAVSSGIYVYRLKTEYGVRSAKMVMLK